MEFFGVPKRKRKEFQKLYTPSKTNECPLKKGPCQKEIVSSSNHYFSGDMLAFWRCFAIVKSSVYSRMLRLLPSFTMIILVFPKIMVPRNHPF